MKTRIALKVRAGARKTGFSGKLGDAWKLQVAAPPVDGKANEAITRFLAKLFGVSASSVRIVTGHTSAAKIVEIEGLDSESAERAILESNEHHP
jgi:uncharacterized protein